MATMATARVGPPRRSGCDRPRRGKFRGSKIPAALGARRHVLRDNRHGVRDGALRSGATGPKSPLSRLRGPSKVAPGLPRIGQCAPFMDTPATTPDRRALANAIRALSMDAVQAANSGHPGAPMGMADIAEVLWRDFLKHNPGNPRWWNRDRFVLSNGHGSMLLYSLLHLTGYAITIDELKNFRQLGAVTAGHPERDLEIG